MKNDFKFLIKIYIALIFALQLQNSSINASAAMTYNFARIAIPYIKTTADMQDKKINHILPIGYSSQKTNAPHHTEIKPTQNFIYLNQHVHRSKQEKSNNVMIAKPLTLEQKIDNFSKKFSQETKVFTLKLIEFWNSIENNYIDYIKKNSTTISQVPCDEKKEIETKQSREEIINSIKKITEKIFDPLDQRPLSTYIADIKKLTDLLDPQEDKKIIDGINFLQKNQHRTNIFFDTPFWVNAIQEQELHKIPTSSHITTLPKMTLLNELQKKANL